MRSDCLAALLECQTCDELYRRMMEIVEEYTTPESEDEK
jgi:hypothetical protein